MSSWDPKDEWRKLRLMTEARYLMEVGADWDTGYSDDGVENKAEEEQKKKDKDQRLRDKKAKDQKEYDKLKKCESQAKEKLKTSWRKYKGKLTTR